MENVFLHLFNMSITAGWLVLAVVVLRLLLKKAPKWLTCLLWVLVAVRLVCPFSIESVLSLIPSAETVPPDTFFYETPVIDSGVPVVDSVINPVLSGSLAPTPMNSVNPTQVLTFIAALVWVAGMVAMAIYALVSTLRLRYKVRESVHLERNIRQCDHIATPFILGVFRPRIYLPSSLDGAAMVSVVAHEEAHLKRRDHWWKPLGFLLLTVYWFNPLLWVAYILLCRDIEAACDEKVVRDMDAHQRKAYSEALLSCSAPRRLVSACPLAFGETGVKARIKSVLHYKKPAFWLVIVAAVAVIVAAVCLLTNPKTEMPEDLDNYISQVILEHNKKETGDGIFACEAHEVFGTEEKGRTITVYALVYYHEYAYAEGELIERSGSCLPTAITVKKKGKAYQLLEYWVPGTDYAKDLQAKFPEAYHSQVLDFPAADLVALLKAKCLRQAEKNFGIEGKQYDTYCYNLAYMKLERDGNECLFCTSSLSSTFPYEGTYTLKERYLYLSVAGGTLTFRRDGDAFVFDRAGSTVTLEGMGASAIVDGVRFTPKIDRRTEYFEPLVTVSGMSHLPEDKRDALYKDVPSGNLPVLALTSPAEVDAFLAEYGDLLNFDPEWDAPTPRERLEGLDDAFFADYSVLAVYYSAGSCSVTPQIVNLSYYKEQGRESILLAEVDVYEPQSGDAALGQWFMLAKVDKAAVKNADTVQAQVRQTIPEDYYFQAFTQPVRDLSKANPMSRWRLSDADQHQLQQMVDRLKWMDDALLDRNLQYDACFRLGDGVTYYLDWSGKVLYDGSRVAALTQEDIDFFDLRLRLSGSASAVQAHVTGTMTGWNKAEDYLLLKVTQSDQDLGDTVKVYTRFYVGSVPSDGATVTVGYDGWPVEGDPMEVYAITMEMSGYADLEGGPDDDDDGVFTGKVLQVAGEKMLMQCYDKDKFDQVWVYFAYYYPELNPRVGDEYRIMHSDLVANSNPPQVTAENITPLSSTPTVSTTTTKPTSTTSGTTATTTTTTTTTTTATSTTKTVVKVTTTTANRTVASMSIPPVSENNSIIKINREEFQRFLQQPEYGWIVEGTKEIYSSRGVYFRYSYARFPVNNTLFSFAQDEEAIQAFLSQNDIAGKVEGAVIFEAALSPITLWVKTTEENAFIVIETDQGSFDNISGYTYKYTCYDEASYRQKYSLREALLLVNGKPVQTTLPVLIQYHHGEVPLTELLVAFGATVQEEGDSIRRFYYEGEEKMWIDLSNGTVNGNKPAMIGGSTFSEVSNRDIIVEVSFARFKVQDVFGGELPRVEYDYDNDTIHFYYE